MRFKYIITIVNEKKFVQHKFDSERIQRRSHMQWHALSPTARSDYVYKITRTTMELNDDYFNIGAFMTDREDGYYLQKEATREMPYLNKF